MGKGEKMAKSGIKVLLVEDSPSDAKLIEHELREGRGYCFEVIWVSRVDKAISELQRQRFDIALLDLTLPDSDGISTFLRIQAAGPQELPIIILTGTGNEEMGIEAVRLGAQDYLVKGSADSESITRAIRYSIERKLAVEALRKSEEYFKSITQNSSDVIIIVNKLGTITYVSPSVERFSGYKTTDLIGKDAFDFIAAADIDKAIHDFGEAILTKGIDIPNSFRMRHKNGSEIIVEGLGKNLLDDPAVEGFVLNVRDVTQRKQMEDLLSKQAVELQERASQLEEINKELESFSYSVSHDLQAPLRAIDGFSRKLERVYGDKLDKEAGRLIDVIRSNTKKMGFLINDLLSFSRVQKINMIISIIDMDKLVNEVWDEIRAINQERKLRFKATKILPGYGDKALIRQVLYNLISNAVKFTVNQNLGIIEMSSYKNNTEVIYCLKDNGTGFDMSYYDKLFGVFQRLHGEQYEGTGIGLAIVQRVVNRHGGRVWAEGEVDKGATFYFTLSETPQNQTTS